ncbi:hypothetical protein C8R43DRAFT_1046390 [Mycena crocata]|nr:hypothetical protein C8R43DRAFT_1046390 [Mycena crocata]
MAHYLPVLLVSVSTNAVPDDSALVTLPRGQVDYLSHEWTEEDVWRSWRNMTRQKNEIANGMRLENASWRTWWKQRNKLKTVTPETLNWLKDSDVTWLYGPLHTAVEWTPPPKPKPDPTEVGKLSSAEDRLDLAAKHKPILKHRSISEMLQSDLLVSPLFSPAESEDGEEEDDGDNTINTSTFNLRPARPPLLQTKSAPHIHRPSHPSLRKPSPPRILPPSMASSNGNQPPTQSSKRHITFNTFVEQCIAVDSPRRTPLSHNSSSSSSNSDNSNSNSVGAAWDGRTRGLRWAEDDDDSDDDDAGAWAGESALSSDSDDALEVCLPRSRSNSSYSRSSRSSHNSNKPLFTLSTDSKTIAPIAPARLKTTGVGNGWAGSGWVGTRDEGRDPEEVHIPRSGAAVDLTSHNLSSAFDADDDTFDEDVHVDDVFTHRSAYFSADGAYDYFAGPDLGVEFGSGVVPREQRGRRGSTGAEILEIEGTSPMRSRSKSRSKSRSRSRTPSPAVLPPTSSSPNVSVSPNASSPPPGGRASGLLSPPPRGRDSSLSSSSSASQGRGRSATRTSSSSSLSDRERSRSSHTSPLGSLSPEYGGVRASADYGTGFPYTYGIKAKPRGASTSVSPDGVNVSPEKGAPASEASTTTTSTEDSNSGSSGATATRPRVEVNGVGAGHVDEEDEPTRNPQTPANSPVVRMQAPAYVSIPERSPPFSVNSSASTNTSVPSSQSVTPTIAAPNNSTSPTSPTSKSIPISPPRKRPGKNTLTVELEDAREVEYDGETDDVIADEARRSNPTPANSPVVRVRVPPRIPGPGVGAGVIGKSKPPSTAKSIPNSKPTKPTSPPKPPFSHVPGSPAHASFQTAASAATAERATPSPSSGTGSTSALQRSLGPPQSDGDGTIVGKAVGIVSTAGAYLGLWSGA